MAAVFIAQPTLDEWSDQGRIRLDGVVLTLIHENRIVRLKPAVRFTTLIGSPDDPHALIGKVKSHEQLATLGAEHYLDSVILGETAYQVVEGFLGDLHGPPKGPVVGGTLIPSPATPRTAATSTQMLDATMPAPSLDAAAASLSAMSGPSAAAPPMMLPPPSSGNAPKTLVPAAVSVEGTAVEPRTMPAAPSPSVPDEVTLPRLPLAPHQAPASSDDAEELSRLFLDTVRE